MVTVVESLTACPVSIEVELAEGVEMFGSGLTVTVELAMAVWFWLSLA